MICQKVTDFNYSNTDNKRHVVAELLASTKPATMPTTGENITYLTENDVLEAGSTMIVVNSSEVQMMNEEHEWKKM